jgi:hypothetical protein
MKTLEEKYNEGKRWVNNHKEDILVGVFVVMAIVHEIGYLRRSFK